MSFFLGNRSLQIPQGAVIGHDVNSSKPITIGERERRSGLYILGRSGTGKTTLIENLIKHDLNHGYDLFFLDPHGDAIDHILQFADE